MAKKRTQPGKADDDPVLYVIEEVGRALGEVLPILLRHPPTDVAAAERTLAELDALQQEQAALGRDLSSARGIEPVLNAALYLGLLRGLGQWVRAEQRKAPFA